MRVTEQNRLPAILVCAKALEELVEHSSRCHGKIVPRISERCVTKLQRTLSGEYRAKSWDWFALTNEQRSCTQYLIAICPVNAYSHPIRGIPACASCGVAGDKCYTRDRYTSNYMLDKVIKLRDSFQENCRFMAPIFISVISANVVVVFRVSHSFTDEEGGVAHLVPPATVAFATDWWMHSVATGASHRKSIFEQYTRLVRSASKDGFVALDVTPFNMLLLISANDQVAPRLVWPACLSWYFADDTHVIQPSILNTVDSCCFTLYVFRQLPKMLRHKLQKTGSTRARKKFAFEQNLANTLLSQEFSLVNQRLETLNASNELVDSMLLLERAAQPFRAFCLLTVKSLAVNYLSQVSLSVASFMLMGFGELARKPTAIFLSDRTRENCIQGTPCNLRHIFSAVNPASASYSILHRFVCCEATQATQRIVDESNRANIFGIMNEFIQSETTQEIIAFIEKSLLV